MKALITGASGFAGSFLCEELLRSTKYEVSGTYLSEDSLSRLGELQKNVNWIKLDLLDSERTLGVIKEIKPDLIFHLAAFTSPADSFKNPRETFNNNISSQLNIFEAVVSEDIMPKILIVSSAEVYGMVKEEDLPVDEETPLMPGSPYAVSKVAQDFLALQYFLSSKLQAIRVRPFNHSGPRQVPNFVIPAFAKKIVDIEKGAEPILRVGNLDAKRDFTDVRDMVKAYNLAIEKGKLGEVYNLGSGSSYRIGDILEMLVTMSSVKNIKIEKDPDLFRPVDTPNIYADASRFRELTGWKPEIKIEKTLADTLDYWRNIS